MEKTFALEEEFKKNKYLAHDCSYQVSEKTSLFL